MFVRPTTSFFMSKLFALAVIGTASFAAACPHEAQLARQFKQRRNHLDANYDAQRDALRYTHKQRSNEFKYERKRAHSLCGHEKKIALHDIDHRRRVAYDQHKHEMHVLKNQHRAARRALHTEYHLARKALKCDCHGSRQVIAQPVSVHPAPIPGPPRLEIPPPPPRFDPVLPSGPTGSCAPPSWSSWARPTAITFSTSRPDPHSHGSETHYSLATLLRLLGVNELAR